MVHSGLSFYIVLFFFVKFLLKSSSISGLENCSGCDKIKTIASKTVAAMFIRDWKKEIQTNNNDPASTIYAYFFTSYTNTLVNRDYDSLKYFDDSISLDANALEKKFEQSEIPLISFEPSLQEPEIFDSFPIDRDIITNQIVLSRIMCTPFLIGDEQVKWRIHAVWNKHRIKLYMSDADPLHDGTDLMIAERLKTFLFFKKPKEKFIDFVTLSDRKFYEIFNLNIGVHRIGYTGEICGFNSEFNYSERVTKAELEKAENYLVDSFPIGGDQSIATMNQYNPVWWSQAKLINAKHIIIGIYNKSTNKLERLSKFSPKVFAVTSIFKNQWSPTAAWSFLDKFLAFARRELNNIAYKDREKYLWTFQSYHNDKPIVVCSVESVEPAI